MPGAALTGHWLGGDRIAAIRSRGKSDAPQVVDDDRRKHRREGKDRANREEAAHNEAKQRYGHRRQELLRDLDAARARASMREKKGQSAG